MLVNKMVGLGLSALTSSKSFVVKCSIRVGTSVISRKMDLKRSAYAGIAYKSYCTKDYEGTAYSVKDTKQGVQDLIPVERTAR